MLRLLIVENVVPTTPGMSLHPKRQNYVIDVARF